MPPLKDVSGITNALPFWLSLLTVPLVAVGLVNGGWTVWIVPLYAWGMISILDNIAGLELRNIDPQTPEDKLFWYHLVTIIWFPIQFIMVFSAIYVLTRGDQFSGAARIGMMFGVGVASGSIGINYAHELMHRKGRLERWLADLLMAMALYGHFRSEHLLVHHVHVATPHDAVTARYNEGFHRFFPRVLYQCFISAWRAEKTLLARRQLPVLAPGNPFWRYGALQFAFLFLAYLLGGWAGIGLFAFQAFVAIWQLELVNYVEHYGLTRKYLGGGKFEHCKPQHSWNSAKKVSNLLLINLQRHSDHHFKPDRSFPLLQNHAKESAPQLPFGYSVMTVMAMIPVLWRRRMNPRVRKWRAMYYPEVVDWSPYKIGHHSEPETAK